MFKLSAYEVNPSCRHGDSFHHLFDKYKVSILTPLPVMTVQSQPSARDMTDGLHADTLTSRKAMAAVEAVAVVAGCGEVEGEGFTTDRAGLF